MIAYVLRPPSSSSSPSPSPSASSLLPLLVGGLGSQFTRLSSSSSPSFFRLSRLLTDDSGPSCRRRPCLPCLHLHVHAPSPASATSCGSAAPSTGYGSSTSTGGDSIVLPCRDSNPCALVGLPFDRRVPSQMMPMPPPLLHHSSCDRCSSTDALGICDLIHDHPQKISTYGHFLGCCPPSSAPTSSAQPLSERGSRLFFHSSTLWRYK